MKSAFFDHIELWLSGLGLLVIWAVPFVVAPEAETWRVVAITAIGVGVLHGLIFWFVRRRREQDRAEASAEANAQLEAQVEVLEARARKHAAALKEKTRRLRRLAARTQSAREKERARIAREVHDVVGQALTRLQFDVTWLEDQVRTERLQEKLREMEEILDATLRTVQEIATELRPGLLDEIGIVATLEWQTKQFEKRRGIRTQFSSEREETALSRERATAMFRIFQEALTNVARHAEAKQVEVRLTEQEGELVLAVEDDGRGITRREIEAAESLGILGMRERANEWGGKLRIEGLARSGTRLTVRLPIGDDNSRRGYHG